MQSIFRPTRTLTGLAVVTAALTAFTAATPPMAVAANTSASACLNGYSGPYAVVNSYGGIPWVLANDLHGIVDRFAESIGAEAQP